VPVGSDPTEVIASLMERFTLPIYGGGSYMINVIDLCCKAAVQYWYETFGPPGFNVCWLWQNYVYCWRLEAGRYDPVTKKNRLVGNGPWPHAHDLCNAWCSHHQRWPGQQAAFFHLIRYCHALTMDTNDNSLWEGSEGIWCNAWRQRIMDCIRRWRNHCCYWSCGLCNSCNNHRLRKVLANRLQLRHQMVKWRWISLPPRKWRSCVSLM